MSHKYTVDQVKKFPTGKPCFDPTKRAGLDCSDFTLLELCDRPNLTIRDRLWVVERFLDEKWRRIYMVRCAQAAIAKVTEETVDPLTPDALTVAEAFANGEASQDAIEGARQQAWEAVRGMKTKEGKAAAMMSARACGLSGENQIVPTHTQDDQMQIMKDLLIQAGS